ncbi:class I SAM-dependent DNA methyltransferase [Bacillus suaedaesalsae]|uniref:Class I SAM-dependent methyltransferase n=1 Tax=Bacillus suaedaesalsae TaxID=2810349 RepID=A0ABS2DNS3_9BACI|nr:class I SAM-dependent methyltransferase [Bacillus suaedaesalsae]MBM6619228.1 class I SAM-dependent methyltransferase [Bacillus suaedaesalsae]
MAYQHFAHFYDLLMKDVPYERWVTYFKNHTIELKANSHLLDLACGTGTLSVPFSKMGLNVTGVDLSTEMLSVADEKARKENLPITFLEMNMTEISGIGMFDYIVCFCDSLNYLESEEEIVSAFKGVYDSLDANGMFMFDVHSIQKMENIFKDQTFVNNDDDVSYIWNCFEGEYPFSVEHELTFFVRDEATNLYDRFDEVHMQRTFPIQQYEKWLREVGFTSIVISSDFEATLNDEQNERIFFCCQKK